MIPKNEIQIFLAHASEDKDRAIELYRKLKAEGYKPWLDRFDLIPGTQWKNEIPKALRNSTIFVACLSATSIQKRGYVQSEFRLALRQAADMPANETYIIPLKLDDCQIPDLEQADYGVNLRDFQWLDYWEEGAFDRLVAAIEYRREQLEILDQEVSTSGEAKNLAIDLWKEKLTYLHKQEAITADPAVKFQLMMEIRECKQKIGELQENTSIKKPNPKGNPSTSLDRLKLRRTLQSLIVADFNDLLYALDLPSGIIPPPQADQASRVDALLNWTTSPSGCGLERLEKTLGEFFKFNIVLQGDLENLSPQQLIEIETRLNEIVTDDSITIKRFDEGSIKMSLEGSEEAYKVLRTFYEEGKLTELCGLPIEKIELEKKTETENPIMTENGLLPIVERNSSDCLGNIIFIHGLMGHSIQTWCHNKINSRNLNNHCWDKKQIQNLDFWPNWLGKQYPKFGIWSFGYSSDFKNAPDTLPIYDQAGVLLEDLKTTDGICQKPIIFIAYSLGGILLKSMLEIANNYNEDLISVPKGIMFLATPHTTSSLPHFSNDINFIEAILKYVEGVVDPAPYVKTLKNKDGELTRLNNWYRQYHKNLNVITKPYYETRKTQGILVVDRDAANPGIENVRAVAIPEVDHQTIAKPVNKDDRVCKYATSLINEVLNLSEQSS